MVRCAEVMGVAGEWHHDGPPYGHDQPDADELVDECGGELVVSINPRRKAKPAAVYLYRMHLGGVTASPSGDWTVQVTGPNRIFERHKLGVQFPRIHASAEQAPFTDASCVAGAGPRGDAAGGRDQPPGD
jgi:hypothetical protein